MGNCLILSRKRSNGGIIFNPTGVGDVKFYFVSAKDAWDYIEFLENPDLIPGRFKPFKKAIRKTVKTKKQD
jgi:hypothetical protein